MRSGRYYTRIERERVEARHRLENIITAGVLAILAVIVVVLSVKINADEARRVDELKRKHANEYAACLIDWKDGKNGGCEWEKIEIHNGGGDGDFSVVDMEVIAKPLD